MHQDAWIKIYPHNNDYGKKMWIIEIHKKMIRFEQFSVDSEMMEFLI